MKSDGTVRAPPTRKNVPGRLLIVCLYTMLYSGPYTIGTNASDNPNSELIFPSSSGGTSFDIIERIAMKVVPLRISIKAPEEH